MDPWEALDIDDSDLTGTLRRCKRRQLSPQPPKTTFVAEVSISPPPTSIGLCSPLPHSQTLDRLTPHSPALSEATASSPKFIPGPAGNVQAAMHLKDRNRSNRPHGGYAIPTQEYIRRAVENDAGGDGREFSSDPWLCAIDFVRSEGISVAGAIGTPISSIKASSNPSRAAQVVAVIKTCSETCLGDLMVTLKDPTGSIGACIHHKVFGEEKLRRDSFVGSVLVLQKVAVFSPSHLVCYLNITHSNVVKVFSKNATVLKQKNRASTTDHSAPGCIGWTSIQKKDLLQGANGAWGNLMQTTALPCSRVNQIDIEVEAKGGSSFSNNGSSGNMRAASGMESILEKLNGNQGTKDIAAPTSKKQMDVDTSGKQANGSNLLFRAANGKEVENGDEADIPTQQLPCSRGAAIPVWTDEQIDVLCAFDGDDDSLF